MRLQGSGQTQPAGGRSRTECLTRAASLPVPTWPVAMAYSRPKWTPWFCVGVRPVGSTRTLTGAVTCLCWCAGRRRISPLLRPCRTAGQAAAGAGITRPIGGRYDPFDRSGGVWRFRSGRSFPAGIDRVSRTGTGPALSRAFLACSCPFLPCPVMPLASVWSGTGGLGLILPSPVPTRSGLACLRVLVGSARSGCGRGSPEPGTGRVSGPVPDGRLTVSAEIGCRL